MALVSQQFGLQSFILFWWTQVIRARLAARWIVVPVPIDIYVNWICGEPRNSSRIELTKSSGQSICPKARNNYMGILRNGNGESPVVLDNAVGI